MYKILITDLETQNHPWLGKVASPFNPLNYVVAPGWRVDTVNDDGSVTIGEIHHRYFNSIEEADAGADWFDVVDDVSLIVAHNSMYEQQWFLSKYRDKFEAFLKRGGRLLCTAMAEYLLSHQQELYPSLDETAPRHGGTHKVDGVKILWEQGKRTSEIDKDLLLEYLIGPSGDIENTGLCFYDQMRQLQEAGMLSMYYERCESNLAFGYCEWFGLFVNEEVAHKNLAEQEAEIARLTVELQKLLPADMPDWVEFNWGSDYHMSALVYGGPVKGRKRVPYDPPQFVKADFVKLANGSGLSIELNCQGNIDLQQDPTTAPYEVTPEQYHNTVAPLEVYKSGKNKGSIKTFREDTSEEKLKWADALHPLPGLVQLEKLPDAVKSKYLGRRAEFRGARLLADGVTPIYSTSTDALKGLKNFVPEVALMVKLASLEKDTGTYYLRTEYNDDGSIKKTKGMLQYVGPDGIVHHSLNTTATVTGRLSSSTPNLQNLPRDGTSKVKEMFTSRWGAEGRIVEVDYSALEVVMLCAMTGDTDLLALLQAGVDMHCYRLAYKLGEPYEDVLLKCKDENHPDHRAYHQMRTDIKPLSFADQYGASAEGIAFNTRCTVEFAQEFQENEAKLFPISRGYREVIKKECERTGMPDVHKTGFKSPSGLHREMDDNGSWRVYRRGHFQGPSGTCYSFRQKPTFDKETRQYVMKYKDTEMANYPFQGESGFMMSSSMGQIVRHMIGKNWYGNQVCLINNVHDAAYLDAANEAVGREAALATKAIMENAPVRLASIFPAFAIGHVPFPAQAEMGDSMFSKTHVH